MLDCSKSASISLSIARNNFNETISFKEFNLCSSAVWWNLHRPEWQHFITQLPVILSRKYLLCVQDYSVLWGCMYWVHWLFYTHVWLCVDLWRCVIITTKWKVSITTLKTTFWTQFSTDVYSINLRKSDLKSPGSLICK